MKEVKDFSLKGKTKIKDLVCGFSEAGGFTAKLVAEGSRIWKEMQKDKKCVRFLSFPACLMATGTRGILKDLVRKKMVDVVITTCGTLDHDIARSFKAYFHGDFRLDDKELHKEGVHRLGNVIFPVKHHGVVIEEFIQQMLAEIFKEKVMWSTRELCWEIGKRLKKDSLLYWAWKNRVPVFIPGPLDGAVGSQLWMFWQTNRGFSLNLFEDEQELSDIIFRAKRTGALLLGGGISKHHTIWWNQFRGGLDYAVQITTAPEWDGSLSGAQTREAISWGKIRENAKHVTIPGDVTVTLPLVIG